MEFVNGKLIFIQSQNMVMLYNQLFLFAGSYAWEIRTRFHFFTSLLDANDFHIG